MFMRLDRRQFSGMLVASLAVPSLPASALTVRGVELGLQAYTFHMVTEGGSRAVDVMIEAMKQLGVDLLELWSPLVEPFLLPLFYWQPYLKDPSQRVEKVTPAMAQAKRDRLRAWRNPVQPDWFPAVALKFREAGIRLFAYNYSFEPTMTDAEIDAGFLQAKALGVDLITASGHVSTAKRVVPFATKHNMRVAFHNHAEKDPDVISGPDSFAQVLAMSPLYRVNLDVAHYAAAGFDAVAYLREHHDVITNVHVHDRKANYGDSVPFGEGIAPTREVLTMIRDNGWKLPVFYELEYVGRDGRDVVAETARELAYERKILES
jgi:hypothetical protein